MILLAAADEVAPAQQRTQKKRNKEWELGGGWLGENL